MQIQREQLWWLGACAAGLGLTALAGGIIGPEIALFALVALAGWLLIGYEGPQAEAGPPLPADEAGDRHDAPVPEDGETDDDTPDAESTGDDLGQPADDPADGQADADRETAASG